MHAPMLLSLLVTLVAVASATSFNTWENSQSCSSRTRSITCAGAMQSPPLVSRGNEYCQKEHSECDRSDAEVCRAREIHRH